jgi:thiol-disulfide isomerase/thioredoxin
MRNKIFAAAIALIVAATAGCASYNAKKVRYMEISGRGCYVCERMNGVVDEISREYGNEVDISTYAETSDTGADLIKKYNITKFPSNIMTDNKDNVIFRYDGLLDVTALKEILRTKGIGIKPKDVTVTASPLAAPSAVTFTPGAVTK